MSYDALAHAQIMNNMVDSESIGDWRTRLLYSGDTSDLKNDLDTIMSNTTIKRACCLGALSENDRYKVKVRIPIPAGYDVNEASEQLVPYGVIDKEIEIPKSFCNAVKSSDDSIAKYEKPPKNDSTATFKCDEFYKVYCPNMMYLYQKESAALAGQAADKFTSDPDDFANFYKPECACYNTLIDVPANFSISNRCLKFPQCTNENFDKGLVYLDPLSREGCPEQVNICTQIANFGGAEAGGDFRADLALRNDCGDVGSSDSNVSGLPGTNTGGSDTGSTNTSGSDTGSTDTGGTDTGSTDTGGTDTGSTDTGSTDTSGSDDGTDAGQGTNEANFFTDDSIAEGVPNAAIVGGGLCTLLIICIICFLVIRAMRSRSRNQ